MTMGHKDKLKGGLEQDVFTDWRKYYSYLKNRKRLVHWVKKHASRRYRREEKERLKSLRTSDYDV
jgi:hypothetical protein